MNTYFVKKIMKTYDLSDGKQYATRDEWLVLKYMQNLYVLPCEKCNETQKWNALFENMRCNRMTMDCSLADLKLGLKVHTWNWK